MRSPPLVFWADKKSRAALHIANGKARSTEKIEPAKRSQKASLTISGEGARAATT